MGHQLPTGALETISGCVFQLGGPTSLGWGATTRPWAGLGNISISRDSS
jgi:hypothetical protein